MNARARLAQSLEGDRPWLLGLCLGALALYARTLCRTVYWYDSAELSTAAAVLGIPHPPGYPLYTLLGKLYVTFVPGEPAFAVNLMSAVHGALCVGLLFVLQRKLGADRVSSALGASWFATGPSFWLNASVAEVYTTGLLFGLSTWVLLLDALARHRRRSLLWAAFCGGLGFAAHMSVATMGLGYVWLAWLAAGERDDGTASTPAQRAKTLALAALATLAGASLYLYVPLRARMHPALSYMDPSTTTNFLWMVTGGNYKTWFLHDYDFSGRLLSVLAMLDDHLSDIGFVVGALGACVLIAKRPALGAALWLGALGNLWFFFDYDVHDVEVFFLPAAALLAACAGPALTQMREVLSHKSSMRAVSGAALVVCCAYLALRAALVLPTVDLSHERAAQKYGQALGASLPQAAILLVWGTPDEWKYRTVFDYYFQKVLGARPDVDTVEVPGDFVGMALGSGRDTSWAERPLPLSLRAAFASGRPVYLYTQLSELEPLLDMTPEGEVVRVRLKRPL